MCSIKPVSALLQLLAHLYWIATFAPTAKLLVLKKLLALLFLAFATNQLFAQLQVSTAPPYDTPQSLVQNVLLGQGVTVSNITFSGDADQIGYFDGTASNVGIGQGLIMATGTVQEAIGPNSQGGITLGGGNLGVSDPDLVTLSNQTINDAAVLEFDFIPAGDSLVFRYVFASDEYNEYACSQFNDVFGFFISGPGFNGPFANNAENIALVPGTTTPVAINSINLGVAGSNGSPGNCDAVDINWPSYNVYFVDNTGGQTIEYDGFTTVLTAFANVQCGQQYHIKLAIGDGVDASFDSGVFLEAESFASNDVQINLEFATGTLTTDSSIVEGCTEATFKVLRNTNDSAEVVHFQLAGSAVNGVDYVAIPDSIVLDSGEFYDEFTIEPILDGVPEGIDTLKISIERINTCGDTLYQSVNVYILDDYQIQLNPVDTAIGCPGDSVPLMVNVTNAINEITWIWSTGDTITTSDSTLLWVTPIDTLEWYYVQVTDSCAFSTEVDSVSVSLVLTDPTSTTIGAQSPCPGQPVTITAIGQGGSGHGFSYQWSSGSTSDTAIVSPLTDSTWYFVTVTDSCTNLTTIDSAQVIFNFFAPTAFTFSPQIISCPLPTTLQVTAFSGSGQGVTYQWSNGSTSDTAIVTPSADSTWYYVTVTDACNGLTATDSIHVIVQASAPQATVTPDQTINCPFDQVTLTATGFGGSGSGYTYEWSTTETTASITVTPMSTATYTVTVGDGCGTLTSTYSVTVNVMPAPPLSVQLADDSIPCPGDPVLLQPTVTGGLQPLIFLWNDGSSALNNQVAPLQTTEYIFGVTDGCGVVVADTATVTVPAFDPVIIQPGDTTLLCAGDPVSVSATAMGGTGTYVYNWSWAGGDSTSVGNTVSDNPLNTSTYFVTATDACNQTGSSTVTVTIPTYDPILVEVPVDSVLLCEGDSVTIEFAATGGTGVYTITWVPNGPGSVDGNNFLHYIPVSSATVTAIVQDQCGLEGADVVYVAVEDCSVRGVNVMTPNGDGMNEVLWFRHIEKNPGSHLIVFDRWGRQVFEATDYRNDWNGDNAPDGTYFYVLTLPNGETLESYFTIMRGPGQ